MNQAAANVLHAAHPHQHSASNVDSFLKVDASSFLRQLGAKVTNRGVTIHRTIDASR